MGGHHARGVPDRAAQRVGGRLLSRFDMAVAVFFPCRVSCCGAVTPRRAGDAATFRPPRTTCVRGSCASCPATWWRSWSSCVCCRCPRGQCDGLAGQPHLTQIYVPLTLTAGLTQMWESVGGGHVLPRAAVAGAAGPTAAGRRGFRRSPSSPSPAWRGAAADPHPQGINFLNWLPAYAWFAAGMLLAEFTVRPVGRVHRWARNRWLMVGIGLVAYLIAASPLAGRKG